MPDPDPVIAALSVSAAGRTRLRDLVAAALYGQARREWEAEHPNRDPAAYIETWTPSQIAGLRERADLLLEADARSVRRADLTLGARLRKLAASALAGLMLLVLLSGAVVFGLRAAGVDVGAMIVQACVPMAPPRYVGQGR